MRSLALMTPVEEVEPGDVIQRPSGTTHEVAEVRRYPAVVAGDHRIPETFVVVYLAHEEASYENKARDSSGFNSRARRTERQWKPLQPGECVPVVRSAA